MRNAFLFAAFILASPVHAQSAQLGVNPLANGAESVDVFALDQAFADAHGVNVSSPVTMQVPRHDGLQTDMIPAPNSGATAVLVFTQAADGAFLEDMQITGFNLPMFEGSADPIHERRVFAAQFMEAELFPQWATRYQGAEIFAIEAIELGNSVGGLQLVAGYYDQENADNMMLRAVILPHPDRIEGYLAVVNVNLDIVPVTDPETLAATLTGRVLSSWQFQ